MRDKKFSSMALINKYEIQFDDKECLFYFEESVMKKYDEQPKIFIILLSNKL